MSPRWRFKVRNPLFGGLVVAAAFLSLIILPAAAQTESGSAVAKVSAPSGPIPRTLDGKPDLSGLWDHPFVIDMSKDGRNNACGAELKGCSQKGPGGGELPMTEWAANWTKNFDPAKYDTTGHCNPMGYTRSMNAPVPTQIVQTPTEVVFLHESMFAFHVVYLDGRAHPTFDEAKETLWYGHSVGHWDGDTLVVDTVGFLPGFLNTPLRNSHQLHVVERFVLDPNKMALTRSYSAEDAVYFKGKYTGSDTILVADAPFNPGKCNELNFIDYSKEKKR